eukprot:scaffold451_cov365-Prasinococcus_capsulatus_cf.AAC.30
MLSKPQSLNGGANSFTHGGGDGLTRPPAYRYTSTRSSKAHSTTAHSADDTCGGGLGSTHCAAARRCWYEKPHSNSTKVYTRRANIATITVGVGFVRSPA